MRRAEVAGIKLIETDVRFAKDGTMVMLHDATLDRTTSLRGPVAERTWAELSVLVLDLKANAAPC